MTTRPTRAQAPWIEQRADPYVYRHTDGWYYFTASVPEYDGIRLRRARSLAELPAAPEKEVWHRHPGGPMSRNIWAPELHWLDGAWYLYFAGGEQDAMWQIRPYVLRCTGPDPLAGPWQELGKMRRAPDDPFSFEAFSLDATVFENGGRRYFVWAEKVSVGQQISNLYIAEMASPWQLKTAQVLLSGPDYDWERRGFWVNEGPAVLRHGGRVFLTYSASDTGPAYCVGLLWARETDDLLDPRVWHKARQPLLQTDPARGIYGPGHNSFTVDDAGNDVLVYHARPTPEVTGNPLYDPSRSARLLPVRWRPDGMPDLSYTG